MIHDAYLAVLFYSRKRDLPFHAIDILPHPTRVQHLINEYTYRMMSKILTPTKPVHAVKRDRLAQMTSCLQRKACAHANRTGAIRDRVRGVHDVRYRRVGWQM